MLYRFLEATLVLLLTVPDVINKCAVAKSSYTGRTGVGFRAMPVEGTRGGPLRQGLSGCCGHTARKKTSSSPDGFMYCANSDVLSLAGLSCVNGGAILDLLRRQMRRARTL